MQINFPQIYVRILYETNLPDWSSAERFIFQAVKFSQKSGVASKNSDMNNVLAIEK